MPDCVEKLDKAFQAVVSLECYPAIYAPWLILPRPFQIGGTAFWFADASNQPVEFFNSIAQYPQFATCLEQASPSGQCVSVINNAMNLIIAPCTLDQLEE